TPMRTRKLIRFAGAVALTFIPAIALVGLTLASSGGISGYSGDPLTNGGQICTSCHGGGVVPTVTLVGPTTVAVGSTNTYTLTITGGQQVSGGLDVAASRGNLIATDPTTWVLDREITHQFPKFDGGSGISWSFDWQAPITPTTITLYAAGNSTNDGQGTNGDAANATSLAVTVSLANNPGETAGPGVDPLLISSFDGGTGNIAFTYGAACGTTDNNVYYGPIDLVSSYWFDDVCAIGNTGSYSTFNPGTGSYFFVVVGNNGADEGSYGRDRQVGVESERPAFALSSCGASQNLNDTCIQP
ncbi:MAG: choice-of-anchor V domain-containing protein, partial [Acidobacteriota bacterium]|nr:choice-of-anchor V domain-containing protein [Acidobacteriota bacterium]